MGKQLYLFQKEVIEEVEIWHRLPEVRRSKIETKVCETSDQLSPQINRGDSKK